MNPIARTTPSSDSMEVADNTAGSDSDSSLDDAPEYYQPISAVGDDDDEEDEDSDDQVNSDEDHVHDFQYNMHQAENGISSLDLNDEVGRKRSEEEEEEERIRQASDSAIRRAFREDESRRNAPLSPENATRVMAAMRQISFGGIAPDWADQVPEDRWINQLRRLRQPLQSTTSRGPVQN